MVSELAHYWGSLETVLRLDFTAFDRAVCSMLRAKAKTLTIEAHAMHRAAQGKTEDLNKFLDMLTPGPPKEKPVQEAAFQAAFLKGK